MERREMERARGRREREREFFFFFQVAFFFFQIFFLKYVPVIIRQASSPSPGPFPRWEWCYHCSNLEGKKTNNPLACASPPSPHTHNSPTLKKIIITGGERGGYHEILKARAMVQTKHVPNFMNRHRQQIELFRLGLGALQ